MDFRVFVVFILIRDWDRVINIHERERVAYQFVKDYERLIINTWSIKT